MMSPMFYNHLLYPATTVHPFKFSVLYGPTSVVVFMNPGTNLNFNLTEDGLEASFMFPVPPLMQITP